ncbi:hypothetical protein GWI34_10060 [Actinomadura sp. DSM 109109]|nr:hypothetical protein [Actinomadura lepetitiana]
MGDVLVANDPVTGQGSSNAARCAAIYCYQIIRHGDRPFDAHDFANWLMDPAATDAYLASL